MAARTFSGTGNYTDVARWDGGASIPSDGDTVTIAAGAVVAITAATPWGGDNTQPDTTAVFTNNGTVNIDAAAGGQLRLRGRYSGGVSGNAGQLNQTSAHATNYAVQVDTATAHVYAMDTQAAVNGAATARWVARSGETSPANYWKLLEVIGTGSVWFGSPASNLTSGQIDLQGVTIAGKVTDGSASNYAFIAKPWTGATVKHVFRLEQVTFTERGRVLNANAMHGRDEHVYEDVYIGTLLGTVEWQNLGVHQDKTTGVRRVAGCAMQGLCDPTANWNGFELGRNGSTLKPLLLFGNSSSHPFPSSSSAATASWEGDACFMIWTTVASGSGYITMGDLRDAGMVFFAPAAASQLVNVHGFAMTTKKSVVWRGLVFDGTYVDSQGDVLLTAASAPASAMTIDVEDLVSLFDARGNTLGVFTVFGVGSNVTVRSKHCTFGCQGDTHAAVTYFESGSGFAGMIEYVKNNLSIGKGSGSSNHAYAAYRSGGSGGTVAATDGITMADYNAFVYRAPATANPGVAGYESSDAGTFASTPGGHDVDLGTTNPLTNPTANAATFYRSVAGGTPSAEPADDFLLWKAELLKYGSASYNSAYSWTNYVAYRRAAAKPTGAGGAAIRTAGEGGTYIGAVEPDAAASGGLLTLMRGNLAAAA
jgi:hypothetical protein